MNVPELIRRKREGGELRPEELEAFIGAYVKGDIETYQVSAFLMAVFFRGMTPAEAAAFTRAMLYSGDTYDLSSIPGKKVDKHSTGGVGDKISLPLAPLVAAAGVVVPMVSGRGLGHTGGTLDKLDSIPGYRWGLSGDEFKKQLAKVGCAIIGQTDNFVPADKKLYALRDVTATVESIPLICGSILSKKVASGTEALVMDVKFGSGAFMPTLEESRALAKSLVEIGTALGRPVTAMLTRMDRPLGVTIGNALEVRESIDILKGKGPADVRELTLLEAVEMLRLAGRKETDAALKAELAGMLDSGKALAKFEEWILAQGGNPAIVENEELLEVSADTEVFAAAKDGFITAMNTRSIGVAGNTLGAGRIKATDSVDTTVGFIVHRNVGDKVSKGEPLFTIHHRAGRGLSEAKLMLSEAVTIGEGKPGEVPLVLETMRA